MAEFTLPDPETRLLSIEKVWRTRYEWLRQSGYLLRRRYEPDWIPSWKGNAKMPFLCEDGVEVRHGAVIDAVRKEDGCQVMIKRLLKSDHPEESEIAVFLSSPPLAADSRNHCCPCLQVLDDPSDPDLQYIVMPLLREFSHPKFITVGEAVEFFRQTFEGLQFMHEHRVAHRDISSLNILMDPKPILPDGFHPQRPWRTKGNERDIRPHSRTARPVKYYFADFGLSRRYGSEILETLDLPAHGADRTVPEFQADPLAPHNPFPTDVYYMGNLIRRDFIQVYTNFTFIEPLVNRMVHDDPTKRPTMAEALSELQRIIKKLSTFKLRERLVFRRDGFTMNLLKDIHHFTVYAVPSVLAFRSSMPTPKA